MSSGEDAYPTNFIASVSRSYWIFHMFRYISQNIFMLETLDDHHINLQVVFFVEGMRFWSVFDGIKDMVVPRFVGVIVEVISQLATLSKFNGRILNHIKCLDNGGLS